MAWKLDDNRPIYLQIIEEIQLRIVAGLYPAGSKLPSVRELAAEAAVNPNTMQKALSELERSGLILTQRTTGRTVTENQELICQAKDALATEIIHDFLRRMNQLGYSNSQSIDLLKNHLKGDLS